MQPSEPADSAALRALRAETEALKKLVVTDELTGIPNLRRYRERLAGLDAAARARGEPYSLAFCDIDSFGRYNKALGQAKGDQTLQSIAATILARMRAGDEVYRRGGEELVVLLPGTDLGTAASVAERIRRAVEDLGIRRGPAPGAGIVTVSIGVASFDPMAPVDPGGVEAAADRAMVAAKHDGKNRVRTAGRDRRDPGGERPEPPSSDRTGVGSVGRMPIQPDTKDWTWVLERTCPECGFDAGSVVLAEVGQMVRDNAAGWQPVLARPDDQLRARPSDDRWSALEYACHVRDVFRLYDQRLALMLAEDDPDFANWDQDETAVTDRYNEHDPAQVAVDIAEAAATLADRFESVDGDAWQRTGNRSDGARFTVDTFARYLVHDPIHHLDDVAKGFAALGF
jgi:diguanylate cyclase (GGDEF)-like protein